MRHRLAVVALAVALLPLGALRAEAAGDGRPPRITASVVSPGRTSATVTWLTDEAADSQVEFGPTTGYGAASTLDRGRTREHVRTLRNLQPARTYHYRIWTRDASGLLTR